MTKPHPAHLAFTVLLVLLAGLPLQVPGTTVNRLCGSGMDAIGIAARAIRSSASRSSSAWPLERASRVCRGRPSPSARAS